MKDVNNSNCKRRRLAQCGSFAVYECECGAIHLIIGYVTIRLEKHAYAEMANVVAEARDLLGKQNSLARLLN